MANELTTEQRVQQVHAEAKCEPTYDLTGKTNGFIVSFPLWDFDLECQVTKCYLGTSAEAAWDNAASRLPAPQSRAVDAPADSTGEDENASVSLQTHKLKIWPQYFVDVKKRRKRFEIRKNDRDFHVGDTVELLEYCPVTQDYVRGGDDGAINVLIFAICYITDHAQQPGYVVFGLEPIIPDDEGGL